MLDILVAILLLGNLTMKEDTETDKVVIESTETLVEVSKLLKIDSDLLSKSMLVRTVKYPGQTIELNLSTKEASDARDSLAKTIYSKIFNEIVAKVNKSLSNEMNSSGNLLQIGLLDIFGFENLASGNSFEQLCINYANEKLQQHRNYYILTRELENYARELPGIEIKGIKFADNTDCIELLEA